MSIRNCSVLLDVSAQTLVYFVRHVSDLPTQLTRKMALTTEFSISHTIKKLQKNKVTLEFLSNQKFHAKVHENEDILESCQNLYLRQAL